MSRQELVLGIDVGTSSAKGVLASPDGRVIATAESPHSLSLPRPGWAEHDPEQVWWGSFVNVCRQLLGGSGGADVAAVCCSGIGPCLLPVDRELRPLRPAILYGIDTRATCEIAELTELFGADAILARCGSLLTTQAVGPKLLWLRRNEPAVWERTRGLLMAHSFLIERLTGEYVLDHHSASQCDPLYDLEEQRWAEDWADEVAPGLPLPRLVWPADIVGRVTRAAEVATGIRAGTPVAAGTIDAWAEALSAGVRRPGDLMIMYGTTTFLVEGVAEASPDERLWLCNGVEPGTRTIAAGTATSGGLTTWLRDLLETRSYEELVAEAANVSAGAGGLVVLPYFAGERTPLFDPDARGLVLGLTLSHRVGHVYRSLLEATAYAIRHNLEVMADAGGRPRRIVAVGGGTKASLWPQIVSDVTGQSQDIPRETIGAGYGDALLAAVAAGLCPSDADWNGPDVTIEPNPVHESTYSTLYGIYRSLYPATVEQMHALARIQEVSGVAREAEREVVGTATSRRGGDHAANARDVRPRPQVNDRL
jgi:xylulokinase